MPANLFIGSADLWQIDGNWQCPSGKVVGSGNKTPAVLETGARPATIQAIFGPVGLDPGSQAFKLLHGGLAQGAQIGDGAFQFIALFFQRSQLPIGQL